MLQDENEQEANNSLNTHKKYQQSKRNGSQ